MVVTLTDAVNHPIKLTRLSVGVVVRNIGDLMGLRTRFERGGRKDAVLRVVNQHKWDCDNLSRASSARV
jgi:hypothetical protein